MLSIFFMINKLTMFPIMFMIKIKTVSDRLDSFPWIVSHPLNIVLD